MKKKIEKKKYAINMGLFLLCIIIAIIGSAPYYVWRDELQELPVVGYVGLMLSCALANGTVFLPASSIVYVVSASKIFNIWACCLIGGIGAAMGEQVGYFCGRVGSQTIQNTSFYRKMTKWLHRYGFFTIFLFAVLPLPLFDIVGVTAGSCRMEWRIFIVASVLGKIVKMFLVVIISTYVLPKAIDFLLIFSKHYCVII